MNDSFQHPVDAWGCVLMALRFAGCSVLLYAIMFALILAVALVARLLG